MSPPNGGIDAGETATTQHRVKRATFLRRSLFRLASIELLAASLSEGKRFVFAHRRRNAERLWFSISEPRFEIHFKKRLTAEMTWHKTGCTQAKGQKTP